MEETTTWDTAKMLEVFGGLEEHLAVEAVLRGEATGRVWVDDAQAPQAGVVWVQHRVFVAGEDKPALNGVVREIAAVTQARGDWGVGVYGEEGTDWEAVLAGSAWRRLGRAYWEMAAADGQKVDQQAGGESRRQGLRLRAVDATLLAGVPLGRLEQLREEMCSERESVEDFLARSFGVCLVDEEEWALAGWCLSEYNCRGRCEVGIEVVEGYRRQGLGTLLAQALWAEAWGRGIERLGWHCLAANEASGATARRAGLRLVKGYTGAVVLVAEPPAYS